ncbi:branched-chain amino acid ABC transporter permease [Chloroflexota bacterium]|nr:branched-chain amino acid ABC transporter permease [Chloroflexota bacterium]
MAYYLTVSTSIAIVLISVMGTHLLTGMNGMFSLGQAAFMGLGAYTASILVVTFGVPFPVAVIISILLTLVVAYLVGFATLRIRQDFFALATFGFGQAMIGLFTESVQLTGGSLGFTNIPRITTPTLAFVSLGVVIFIVWSIRRSHFGRDSLAIRGNDMAAKSSGIDIFKHRMVIFLIASAFAAYAGVLLAFYNRYIDSNSFGWMISVTWIIIVFFGGRDSLIGTLMGGIILLALPEVLRFAAEWRITLYCLTILFIINVMPKGLFGSIKLPKFVKQLFTKKRQEVE